MLTKVHCNEQLKSHPDERCKDDQRANRMIKS